MKFLCFDEVGGYYMKLTAIKQWPFFWGVFGVATFLLSAIYRIWPGVENIFYAQNDPAAYFLLAVLTPLMLYLEGYRGFYKSFTPRVVSRAKLLGHESPLHQKIMAPLFCMGFICSSLQRKFSLYMIILGIYGLVIWVKSLSQPWRWVIDLSVSIALFFGVLTIMWVAYREWHSDEMTCDSKTPK
ncbi:MAG: hypothetical protein COA46_12245 [Porticoccaceae bacterium]|nr:MAG: hypothetical protein COA46_12245 [Porticoccaceae bacterium]